MAQDARTPLILPDKISVGGYIQVTESYYKAISIEGGWNGRAAWREIKSDCLGKSEPSTRAPSEPRHRRSFTLVEHLPPESSCRIPSREKRRTRRTYVSKTLAILGGSSSLAAPVSLLASRVCFNPFVEPLQPGRNKTRPCSAHRPKYFPNSNKVPRCIIYRRARLYNKFLSYTTGIFLSSFRRAIKQSRRELFIYTYVDYLDAYAIICLYTYDIFNTKFMSQRDTLSRDFFQTKSK